jgi:hypothetical protein
MSLMKPYLVDDNAEVYKNSSSIISKDSIN